MSASKAQLQAQAEALRKKLAVGEAAQEILRSKLAKIEAQLDGAPVPVTGLDLLWKAALPTARLRSSKMQCRTEWNRIPKSDLPTVLAAVAALKAWNRSQEWKNEGNRFVPGLHKFIKNRMWEDLPEGSTSDGMARYRNAPKPLPQTTPGESATAQDIAELMEALKPKRMPS